MYASTDKGSQEKYWDTVLGCKQFSKSIKSLVAMYKIPTGDSITFSFLLKYTAVQYSLISLYSHSTVTSAALIAVFSSLCMEESELTWYGTSRNVPELYPLSPYKQ